MFNRPVPEGVMSWLYNPSSLTKRLIQRCPDKFRVELLSQMVKRPTFDEARRLNIRSGRSALIREVLLYCGDTAVVYARTVIPLSTLTGPQKRYANLGNRPLGAMLFADRSMRRDTVEITALNPGDVLYVQTRCEDEIVWGRRSVFHVGGKPLLVSEYFLPSLTR